MDKMKLPVMVVKRELLFAEKFFEGFIPHREYDFGKKILDHCEYIRRQQAEETPSFQQPIPYAVICDKQNRLFVYQRASKKEHTAEIRLHGKWSCGVGGHVDEIDGASNPLYASLLREITEELGVTRFETIEPIGYINDESTPVSQVHFGILYRVIVKDIENLALSKEIATGMFLSPAELRRHLQTQAASTEEWTSIALKALGIL